MTDGSSRDPEPEQRKAPGGKERLLLLPDADLLGLATALAQSSATGAVSAAQLPVDILDGIRQRILRPGTVRRPLHPLLSASCRVTEMEVSDYREKALTVGIVADWASAQGLPSRHVLALEQAVDELLLNALYDAPRDASGSPRYASVSPADRVFLRALAGESARVRFASDGVRVAVGVADFLGHLRRNTVLDYLIRCATAQARHASPLEQKKSGAGVGLFLTAMAASELLFRLWRGRLTEIVFCQYLSRPRPLRVLLVDERL
ncbi:MAG TPA: hypothetical protein PKO07_20215 [Pseudomonadota bacterium]|nr:hypothetical protein [Pseudomonadota bacterium]HNN53367.1 hypothetical protein [Pseudomonadota bacterium]